MIYLKHREIKALLYRCNIHLYKCLVFDKTKGVNTMPGDPGGGFGGPGGGFGGPRGGGFGGRGGGFGGFHGGPPPPRRRGCLTGCLPGCLTYVLEPLV